jgi:hypothetical protein
LTIARAGGEPFVLEGFAAAEGLYATTPSEKMSARASRLSPTICSGDM